MDFITIAKDGRVNVPGLLLVEGPYPRLIVVGADDDGEGRAVDTYKKVQSCVHF